MLRDRDRNSKIYIVKDARQEFNLDVFSRSLKSVLYPATDAQVTTDAQVPWNSQWNSLIQMEYTAMDLETFSRHLRRVASRSEPGDNCVSLKSYMSAEPPLIEHFRRYASRAQLEGRGVFPGLHGDGSSGFIEQHVVLRFAEQTLADAVFSTIGIRSSWHLNMKDLENKIFEVPNGIVTFNHDSKTYRGAKEDLLFCLEKLCLNAVQEYRAEDPEFVVSERITDKAASAKAIEPYLTPLSNSVSVHSGYASDIFEIIYDEGEALTS